jgi:chromosome segregation ATPase
VVISSVILVVALAGIASGTIQGIAKAIGRRGASGSELARLKEQLQQVTDALEDAQAAIASQAGQLAELQERVDFAERALAQARSRPALGPGPEKRE